MSATVSSYQLPFFGIYELLSAPRDTSACYAGYQAGTVSGTCVDATGRSPPLVRGLNNPLAPVSLPLLSPHRQLDCVACVEGAEMAAGDRWRPAEGGTGLEVDIHVARTGAVRN